jgi:hypothetical protein
MSHSSEQHVLPVCCIPSLFYIHIRLDSPMVWPVPFLGVLTKLWKAAVSFVIFVFLSVRPSVYPSAKNNSAPTGRIFAKFDIWMFFEYMSRKINFHYLTRITGTLHENQHTFLLSRLILLTMRNVSDKTCRKSQKTHFMFGKIFPQTCRLRPDRPQMTM